MGVWDVDSATVRACLKLKNTESVLGIDDVESLRVWGLGDSLTGGCRTAGGRVVFCSRSLRNELMGWSLVIVDCQTRIPGNSVGGVRKWCYVGE